MAKGIPLELVLKLKDQASKGLGPLKRALGGIGKAAVGLGMAGAGGVAALGGALTKLAADAAPLANVKAAFEGISGDATAMLSALQAGSSGMVTNIDLMKSYNMAAQLVSKDFADQLPNAMQYLQKAAAATGESMDYMITSLVRGVGRMSPMILDNLGIQVSLSDAVERASEMFGVEADALSKTQQQAGMMAVVMEKLKANTAAMPEVVGTAAQQFAAFRVTMQNLKTDLGMALLPAMQAIMAVVGPLVTQFASGLTPALVAFGNWLASVLPGAIATAQTMFATLSAAVRPVISMLGQTLPNVLAMLSSLFVDRLAPAISTVANWLRVNLSMALQTISAFVQGTLLPVLSQLVTWFQANLPGAIATLSAWLSSVLPGAIIASRWLFATLSGAAQSVANMLGQALPQALTLLTSLFEQKLRPALRSVTTWLASALPDAIATASSVFNTLSAVVQWVASALGPVMSGALIALGDVFAQRLIPAISTTITWLRENLPAAFQAVGTFVQSTLLPVLVNLATWFQANLPRAIAVVNSVLGALGAAAQSVAGSLGQSLPGALNTLSGFFTQTLGPAISTAINWLASALPAAIATARSTFTTLRAAIQPAASALGQGLTSALTKLSALFGQTLAPAISSIVTSLRNNLSSSLSETVQRIDTLSPSLADLAGWLQAQLPAAIAVLSNFFDTKLLPAFNSLFSTLANIVLPALVAVGVWIGDNLPSVFEALGNAWHETLQPALSALATVIVENLLPLLKSLAQVITMLVIGALAVLVPIIIKVARALFDVLYPILQRVSDFIAEHLVPAIRRIGDVMDTIRGVIDKFGNALWNLADKLPSWLRPGSPSPLQIALQGISAAMKELAASSVPALAGALGKLGDALGATARLMKELRLSGEAISANAIKAAITRMFDFVNDLVIAIEEYRAKSFIKLSETMAALTDWQDDFKTMSELFKPLADMIAAATSVVQAGAEEVPDFKLAVSVLFDNIIQLVADLAEYISDPDTFLALTETVGTLGDWQEGFEQWATVLEPLEALLSVLNGVSKAASAQAHEIGGNIISFFEYMKHLMIDVVNYMRTHPAVAEAVAAFEVIGPILTRWKTAMEPLADLLDVLHRVTEVTSKSLHVVHLNIVLFFDNMLKALLDTNSWVQRNESILSNAVTLFETFSKEHLAAFGQAFEAILGPIQSAAQLSADVAGRVGAIRDNLISLFGGIEQIRGMIREWLEAGGAGDLQMLLAQFVTAILDAMRILSTGTEGEIGFESGMLMELLNEMNSILESLKQSFIGFYSWLTGTYREMLASISLTSAGRQIGQSLADGLMSALPAVQAAAAALAAAAEESIRSLLDMHSQSTVMFSMGQEAVSSFWQGFAGGGGLLLKRGRRLVEQTPPFELPRPALFRREDMHATAGAWGAAAPQQQPVTVVQHSVSVPVTITGPMFGEEVWVKQLAAMVTDEVSARLAEQADTADRYGIPTS